MKDAFEATLTLLYRLLFLLYAEARDLLPIREAAYKAASLKQIKEEIAEKAGIAETDVPTRLNAYPDTETTLYDHLARLFGVMDQGDAVLNVPCYNGGLFLTEPDHNSAEREHRIARFLLEHKVPDRYLALAIDRLARDVDEKNFSLAFIDYKSLEVRHLGSIYEGLLEFKLKIAEEDLTTTTEKKAEKYIPLSQAKPGRGKKAAATPVVRKGEVYLSNDKAERKATGSYYTPDPIVEYIVEHSDCSVLLIESEAQWERIAGRRAMLARLRRVVMMDGAAAGTERQLSWTAFMALGADAVFDPEAVRAFLARFGPFDPEAAAAVLDRSIVRRRRQRTGLLPTATVANTNAAGTANVTRI